MCWRTQVKRLADGRTSHWNAHAEKNGVTPAMVGHWEGNARIIVIWAQQTNLLVKLDIHKDGSVCGKVGDATLASARLAQNRGWLGRNLNMWTDYLVMGDLSGPLLASEGVQRKGAFIPLNFTGGEFVGGVATTGWKVGGKEHMVLSASSLRPKKLK